MSCLKTRIFDKKENDNLELVLTNDRHENIFVLEKILDSIIGTEFVSFSEEEKKSKYELDNQKILLETDPEEDDNLDTNIILYELAEDTYYVYIKDETDTKKYPKLSNSYSMFVPTGVTIRRVSQSVLGTGVLGRAFVNLNYIEILDSLVGHDYQEVLTHEVLHILYPEKREIEIRQLTRNHMDYTRYN